MTAPLPPDEIDRTARRQAAAPLGGYAHAAVFRVMHLGLAGMALATGHRRWSVFPALGRGLGLVLHGVSAWGLAPDSDLRDRMVEHGRLQRQQGGR